MALRDGKVSAGLQALSVRDTVGNHFTLGEAQRAAGQPLPARLTWTDLARDIERMQPAEATDTLRTLRRLSASEIQTRMLDTVRDFCSGNFRDDATLLVLAVP